MNSGDIYAINKIGNREVIDEDTWIIMFMLTSSGQMVKAIELKRGSTHPEYVIGMDWQVDPNFRIPSGSFSAAQYKKYLRDTTTSKRYLGNMKHMVHKALKPVDIPF